jgi:hypothetical protein
VVLTAAFNRRAIGQQIARFFHPLGIVEHLAGQDKRLRPGAAFRQPKRYKQQIGALFWRAGHFVNGPRGAFGRNRLARGGKD